MKLQYDKQPFSSTAFFFCETSRQEVSIQKTRIFSSPNVRFTTAEDICNMSGFTRTVDLERYLGVPMLHKRVTKGIYWTVVEQAQKRLAGWKANQLSLAGRITLCHFVVMALPTCTRQTTRLPNGVCDTIEKFCRKFIWGETETSRKIHLINWDTICQPKENGGVGLQKLSNVNEAFLMKLGWELLTTNQNLWA